MGVSSGTFTKKLACYVCTQTKSRKRHVNMHNVIVNSITIHPCRACVFYAVYCIIYCYVTQTLNFLYESVWFSFTYFHYRYNKERLSVNDRMQIHFP